MPRKAKTKRRGRPPLPKADRREVRSVRLPASLWARTEAYGELTATIERALMAWLDHFHWDLDITTNFEAAMATEFERIVTFTPAFDKRHADPKKNYGIHGVELRMVLKGPLGATQFVLYTNWQLPHVTEEHMAEFGDDPSSMRRTLFLPNPADLGYHWATQRYENQHSMECNLLPEGECYCDGSGLNAERIYEVLLKEGSDGVWRELESYYHDLAQREAA